MTNKTLIFKKIPTGFPVEGEHLVVEDRGFDTAAAPPPGGVMVRILYASFDPYQRGRMRSADVKSYAQPYQLDQPIINDTVSRVLKSDSPDWAEGDLLRTHLPTAEYAAVSRDALKSARKIDNRRGFKDLALFIGPLGMPGLTAWSSFHEIGQPKAGETIFISSAAGAVGQVVGQIAKREGLRVIGSVGNDDKLAFITNELGFDAGFNYKKEAAADALERLAPDGIDIYYENVGGEQLDAALAALRPHGRIIASGMISQYNLEADKRYAFKNLMKIVSNRLTIRGFLVGDPEFGPKYYAEHQDKMQQWLADGSVKAKLHVVEGIDNAAKGLIGIFKGENFGKAVLKVADE